MYVSLQSVTYLTMYFSHLSSVNVGIINTLSNFTPLIAAILDYFINNEKLSKYHLVGLFLLISSAIVISLSPNQDDGVNNDKEYV